MKLYTDTAKLFTDLVVGMSKARNLANWVLEKKRV